MLDARLSGRDPVGMSSRSSGFRRGGIAAKPGFDQEDDNEAPKCGPPYR